jgi:hypothetical protein
MGGTYSMHGRDEKYKILVGKLKRRENAENLGVYGRIILKWLLVK